MMQDVSIFVSISGSEVSVVSKRTSTMMIPILTLTLIDSD